jgi:uncharacterized membrane protein YbhN (UPF0104 family)
VSDALGAEAPLPQRRRPLLSWVVGLVVLALAVWLVWRNADDVARAAREVGLATFALAGVLGLLGTLCVGGLWVSLLHGAGVRPPAREAFSVFFVTQLGKYLPGAIWPVVAQMEWGRRWGSSRRPMLAVNILLLALVTVTGLLVGLALLPWSSGDGLARYWWTLLFVLPLLATLHPRVVPALLDRALALVGRPALGLRLTGRSMVQALGWCAAMWCFMGLHLWVMTHALGATGVTAWAAATGAMALGWAAGLIVIPAPAGAGVREAVLVATLAAQVGSSPALAVAVASRVLLLLADVALAALSLLLRAPLPTAARSGRGTAASG